MKTVLYVTAAAAAFVATAAQAQTHQTTYTREYATVSPITPGGPLTYNAAPTDNSADPVLAIGNNPTVALGTRYTATSTASDDTETATPTVSNTFTLTGTVSRDC